MADEKTSNQKISLGFIGSTGVPNRYGGFESFLENCGAKFLEHGHSVTVTCDASLYKDDADMNYKGMKRIFLKIKANGPPSILHDLVAFLRVYTHCTHIIVLGVSGGPWFPLFLLMCRLGGKRLGVNIDGVEWRRAKFSRNKQLVLRVFDYLAQYFSDVVVYDNAGLKPFVYSFARNRSVEIGYSGDHVIRMDRTPVPATALTICRVEPENNLDILIEGALLSKLHLYTIVGNWNNSNYGRALRHRYRLEPNLLFLDPIYDPQKLAELRESCAFYLHGHSVGGTNPSLVEMLFYDCRLCCFDVVYNRVTAGKCASFFKNATELSEIIDSTVQDEAIDETNARRDLRLKFTSDLIVTAYIDAITFKNRK